MTTIWAHRGASGLAPENTMEAFRLAAELGAHGIELDVQRTADGHLVVIHDETVNRTTDGTGAVVDFTLEELQGLDASMGAEGFVGVRIPTLREVLTWVLETDLMVNIELKNSIERYPGMEDEAVAIVQELGLIDQTVFSSFHHGSVVSLVGRVGKERLALLLSDSLVEPWRYVADLGVGGVHPSLSLLQELGWVDAAHERGLVVRTWPVNTPDHVIGAAALDVDVLMTDFPNMAKQALEAAEQKDRPH